MVYRQGETDMLYRSFCLVRLSDLFQRFFYLQEYIVVWLSDLFTENFYLFLYYFYLCVNYNIFTYDR